jgi:hypothetical protein
MVQATFTVSGAEFNAELIERIKSLFVLNGQPYEVFIRVKRKETSEEMKSRIERSIKNMEEGKQLVTLSGDEFETLVAQLSQS